jgi:hypothetical protein
MPKVAQHEGDPIRREIVSQPLAQGAPAAAFGAPIAQGLTDIARAGINIKQRVDTTSAEEALVAFERDKNDVFFNPDTGYFNTQGRNAYDNSTLATKALEDLKKQHGKVLGEQARIMFDKSADAHITRGQSDISRHASKGLKAWEIATLESQVENSIENASLFWDDPDRLRVQTAVGRQAIIDSSELAGIGPEATAEKLQTFDSSFAKTSIDAALSSSAAEGEKALENYGDRLEGPDKIKLEKQLDKVKEAEKTQANANAAVLASTGLVNQFDNRSDIRDAVNEIEDPELRKVTMAEAMNQFSRKEQADKEKENAFYQNAISLVNEGATPVEIAAQDSEAWLGMNDIQRNNILSGKHMITDQALFQSLRSLPATEKAKLNAVDFSDKLKPADLNKLTTEIEAAKKGKQGSRIRSLASKSIDAAESAFGKKSKWTTARGKATPKGKLANQFLSDLQESLDEAELEKGSKLTPAEENQLIGDSTRQIAVQRSAFGFDILAADTEIDLTNTPAKDLRMLNRIVDSTPNIELEDLVSSYQLLVDSQQPITPENLREVYRQGRQ